MSERVEEALISDPDIATLVNEKLNMATSALDESIAIVQEQCSKEEFVQYRNAVGKVLAEMFEIVIAFATTSRPEIRLLPGYRFSNW